MSDLPLPTDPYVTTRDQLRGIAESLIAGPQYRAAGTIRLAARPTGFVGTALAVGVQGTDFVWPAGRAELVGAAGALAAAAGLPFGPPTGVYDVTDPLPADTELSIDPAAAHTIFRSLYAGAQALIAFDSQQRPVLWPEHFDVAGTVAEVIYGLSPGDSFHPRPYAYVSPQAGRTGVFWNAPFGAFRALDPDVLDPDVAEIELVGQIVDFFVEGRRHL